jgi:hypothetical protein
MRGVCAGRAVCHSEGCLVLINADIQNVGKSIAHPNMQVVVRQIRYEALQVGLIGVIT